MLVGCYQQQMPGPLCLVPPTPNQQGRFCAHPTARAAAHKPVSVCQQAAAFLHRPTTGVSAVGCCGFSACREWLSCTHQQTPGNQHGQHRIWCTAVIKQRCLWPDTCALGRPGREHMAAAAVKCTEIPCMMRLQQPAVHSAAGGQCARPYDINCGVVGSTAQ